MSNLHEVAQKLVEKPRGILAMDESTGTATKRLEGVGVESTEETRRDYREMITSTENLGSYISGAILFDETFWQEGKTGKLLRAELEEKDIMPGIKVDTGAKDHPEFPGGKITTGLDGLPDRLKKYAENGAKFAKWRAVLTVDFSEENSQALEENMIRLATYAHMCQQAGIVPIVEPEVLMDGSHGIQDCAKKTREALNCLYKYLKEADVDLKGTLLKPNMVHEGKSCEDKSSHDTVARETLAVLKECVPEDVAGIVFLSGGLSDDDATEYLKLMNQEESPWNLSYSYGRALQQAALKVWAQKYKEGESTAPAQAILLKRSQECSEATKG